MLNPDLVPDLSDDELVQLMTDMVGWSRIYMNVHRIKPRTFRFLRPTADKKPQLANQSYWRKTTFSL